MRTHTSPVQIRTMMSHKPPLAIIIPGKVYRPDSDQTHSPIFHQIEGLLLSKQINMGHLKHTLLNLCKHFFQIEDLKLRFRPSYFPFTEPSAEVDIGCYIKGKEIKLGGDSNWLEVLGAGMIHPNVLINCNIDPEQYQGFAFGIGVERFAMLKYGISDLREFYESNLRWINTYGFNILDSISK
jgi:phenylalanyl-tRNA synthetase alpha chain